MNKTRVGLHLRAVGENPATADAAGISVSKYKYAATIIGGAIAALGGFYYIMDYTKFDTADEFLPQPWFIKSESYTRLQPAQDTQNSRITTLFQEYYY